jgi:hypothetical protein
VVPLPSSELNRSVPPNPATNPFDTASPSPVPLPNGLVEKNGSNRWLNVSWLIPAPSSSTRSSMRSPFVAATSRTRPWGREAGIASSAFDTRLANTCTSDCSCALTNQPCSISFTTSPPGPQRARARRMPSSAAP